ncbi:hypothetical protein PA598K_04837 [Paenibacillus sp. 598K]|uniref:S-layer homology domain-containing protein n=1 Tax=Paenibacillus sp. 598K TaxID=1117987 RepID=UPI000FFA2401|nr:S-layer homology domain-containing protein [Paenibacillus sp. 598K]GBF76371.1 hypothetical protein PA598K_04837 [Paenibacillus sp. 598K]
MRVIHAKKTVAIVSLAAMMGALNWGWAAEPRVEASDAPPAILVVEDFEDGIADVKFNPKRMYDATLHLEDRPKLVRNGQYSARIDYDMIDVVDNPSQIEVGYTAGRIPVTGYPAKVGMWVYGNNEGHLLTTKFRDQGGSSFQAEFYDETSAGINWSGWKYIEAAVPQGKSGPIVLELFFQLKQSNMSKKNKGSLWVDDITFIYEETGEDRDVPLIQPLKPVADEVLSAPLEQLKVALSDSGSGLDLDTLAVRLDGEDITSGIDYSAETGLLTYPGNQVDGGYHELVLEVKDRSGNPASTAYAFTVDSGERLYMSAAEEAVSNELYPVRIGVKDYAGAEQAQFTLHYDPGTLQVADVSAAAGVSVTPVIDNAGGVVQLALSGLSAAAARDAVTVNFRVDAQAVLARGEAYKSIRMRESSLMAGQTQTSSPLAAPLRYTIAFPYQLSMTGVGLGTTSTLTVRDREGRPYAGADIVFKGLLGESSLLTVTAATSPIYADDDASSAVLRTAQSGERYYGSAESDDGWFETILPDGRTGYIAEADVSAQLLNGSLGQTDADGVFTTDLTTLALGAYQLQAIVGDQNSKVVSYEVVEPYGTDEPQHVQTYVTEDLSSQLSVAWQTRSARTSTAIQYIEAAQWGAGAEPDAAQVREQLAESELQVLSMQEKGSKGEIRFHNVLVEGLKPATAYKYRVGYEGNWTAWHDYTTVDRDMSTPTSFFFITDSHTNQAQGMETYQSLMTEAMRQYPTTQFVMHGGDMVDAGGAFEEWRKFWQASSVYATRLPSALTLGNHDVKSEGKDVFTKGANFPVNGPEGQRQYAYAYDIDDAHFVVLNSEGTEEQMIEQAAWLEEDLSNNDKKWTIAMFHRPAYHTENGRGSLVEYTQQYFAPILEAHKVDLVLVGHDHVYARTYPMQGGKPLGADAQGTVYLDGGASGWKFYEGMKYDYLNYIFDEDVPVYSHITVAADKIQIEARTIDGRLFDTFSVAKPKPSVPWTPSPYPQPETKPEIKPEPQPEPTPEQPAPSPQPEPSPQPTPAKPVFSAQVDIAAVRAMADKASAAAPVRFTDVSVSSWSASFIERASRMGIVKGYGDGSYRPQGKVTRAEFATMLAHAFALPASGAASFSDTQGHWAAEAIAALQATGAINGYPDGAFRPNQPVTRAEIVAMLARFTSYAPGPAPAFPDVAQNNWASEAIAAFAAAGIVHGDGEGRFQPDASASRAESVTMIIRLLDLLLAA